MIGNQNVIPGGLPETTQVTEDETSPEAYATPARPAVRPEPAIRPRGKAVRTGQAAESELFFDPNDGVIKQPQPIRVPEPTPVVSYARRDHD